MKQQKISEYLSKSTPKPATPKEVLTKMDGYFKQKLSPLELEDLQLAGENSLLCNVVEIASWVGACTKRVEQIA